MAINFDKPIPTDNYSTAILPNLRDSQIALAQWLDPAVAGTITGPVTGMFRLNNVGGAAERYNGSSWAAQALNGLLYNSGAPQITSGGLAVTGVSSVRHDASAAVNNGYRIINNFGTANSGAALSLDPGNNGWGVRDALIVATNNGSNAITASIWTANAAAPTNKLSIGPTGAIGMLSGQRLYFDGIGLAGDTYIYEVATNTVDFYVGNTLIERRTATGLGIGGAFEPRAKLHVNLSSNQYALMRAIAGSGGTAFGDSDTIPIASGNGFTGYGGLAAIPNRWGNASTADEHTAVYLGGAQRNSGAVAASIAWANWGYFTGTTAAAGHLGNATAQADAVKFTQELRDLGAEFTQRLVWTNRSATGVQGVAGYLGSNGNWGFGGDASAEGLRVVYVASAVNRVHIQGAVTTANPKIFVKGDADRGLDFEANGTTVDVSEFRFRNGSSAVMLRVGQSTGTIANSFVMRASLTGVAPILAVEGSDTNINLNLVTKGTGVVQVNGSPLGLTLVAEVATTSGTSVDITGIPAGTKQITINLVGVGTSGTSLPMVQIGDSGGIEATGYTAAADRPSEAATNFTTGFGWSALWNATYVSHGSITLTLQNASTNLWCVSGQTFGVTNATYAAVGTKALSAVLDRIRLTTVGGTDTFDAGAVSISYQ